MGDSSTVSGGIRWIPVFSAVLELLGVACVAFGLWLLAPWIGVVALGVGLLIVGLAVDPPRRGA